ncbi:mannose-1-phosphate guanylyltransferase [Pontixanthobacter sp.]|uniref:mannose-1-phosphate guanylyltransferase n=1 Tax=Pontixanthobacter sp. TaxID=2792078 RepID=UPI003C79E0C3
MIHPVILCGGSGTRLWPRSRADHPKPFLPLVGPSSLFEQTIERTADRSVFAAPWIVTGAKHADLVSQQLDSRSGARIMVEPAAKNTAPAIALAALRLPEDAIMLVCPSDHYIEDTGAFVDAVRMAAALAQDGRLVAFGIEAVTPETGYGYIKRGAALGAGFEIERFVEKPDAVTAKTFLANGGYSWNGGIFVFEAGVFLAELTAHRPDMIAGLRAAVEGGVQDGAQFHPDAASFAAIEGDSIDYAVMERTRRAAVVPVSMGWSDIGNWPALHNAREQDGDGNTIIGPAEAVDCTNVLIESDGPRVSAIGLENIMIVVDGDEVLVTTADGAQKVGTLHGASSQ